MTHIDGLIHENILQDIDEMPLNFEFGVNGFSIHFSVHALFCL